jgi:hypothetical protein
MNHHRLVAGDIYSVNHLPFYASFIKKKPTGWTPKSGLIPAHLHADLPGESNKHTAGRKTKNPLTGPYGKNLLRQLEQNLNHRSCKLTVLVASPNWKWMQSVTSYLVFTAVLNSRWMNQRWMNQR